MSLKPWLRRLGFLGLMLLALALGFVVLDLGLRRWVRGEGSFPVPDLVGLSREEAYQSAARRGLLLEEGPSEYDAWLPAGFVLRQRPHAPEEVKEGRRVKIVLSAGPRLSGANSAPCPGGSAALPLSPMSPLLPLLLVLPAFAQDPPPPDDEGEPPPPPSVPEEEILRITQQMSDGINKPKPKVLYSEGDTVRVVDGPFANFNGVVEEVRPEKGKLRVLVSIFGRATPVELVFVQVEKS